VDILSVGRIAGVGLKYLGGDGGQILGQGKAILHALDGLLARIAVGLWRELQEPLIELVNRSPCVSLPEMGFVSVDGHLFTLAVGVENATSVIFRKSLNTWDFGACFFLHLIHTPESKSWHPGHSKHITMNMLSSRIGVTTWATQ
jgi:hypothetical protein